MSGTPTARRCKLWRRDLGRDAAKALRHIREVVAMVVAELIEDGETVPADEPGSAGTLVSVTV